MFSYGKTLTFFAFQKHLDELLVPINAMFSGGGVEATKTLRSNRQRQTFASTAEGSGKVQVTEMLMTRPHFNNFTFSFPKDRE